MTHMANEDPRFEYAGGIPLYLPRHWGRDHATLLLYVETRGLDHEGQLLPENMRTNLDRHVHEAHARRDSDTLEWKPEYGTRIVGDERPCEAHDDWDCLDDMEEVELLCHTGPPNFLAALSPLGIEVAGELRKYKGRKQPLGEFDFDKVIVEACGRLGIDVPEHVQIGGDQDAEDSSGGGGMVDEQDL